MIDHLLILRDAALSRDPAVGALAAVLAESIGAAAAGVDGYGVWVRVEVDGVPYRLRWIWPGAYLQGSPESEEGRFQDEGPQRIVVLTRGFWIGETPVTQALYRAVTDGNPSRFAGADRPVEQVSHDYATAFCASLSERLPLLGWRLPTEAEWEYACRAGTTGARYGELDDIAWHWGNSNRETRPVGLKQPNPWGLHDMLGNVWEWCSDRWDGRSPYPEGEEIADPVGKDGPKRVIRGGSWYDFAGRVRAADRLAREPGHSIVNLGFRAVADPVGEDGPRRALRGGSFTGVARRVRAAFRLANGPGRRGGLLGFRLAGGAP